MTYYLAEIKFNKSKSENSRKKAKNRKQILTGIVTLTLISLLISAPTLIFSVAAVGSGHSLSSILNDLGFTNIALVDTETFSPGMYNITLLAEFASYYPLNVLSYYAVDTNDYQTIFSGPEGTTKPCGGYVVPPLSKTFAVDTQFGLSLLAPEHRYFTEHWRNPDYPEQHSRVYVNLDFPDIFLIGFENYFGGWKRDYNDIVFSLMPVNPLEIVNVTRSPEVPNYDQSVTVTSQVAKGSADIDSVILSYQIGSSSWINLTPSLESSVYVADIPAQPYSTTVNYKVYASDTIENSDVSALYSYTVDDFVPPVISNVVQVPRTPDPNESVTVSATVTEPSDASGVKNVSLWYTNNNTVWSSVGMALHGGAWEATISGQSEGVNVKFVVYSFDKVGNNARTSNFSYTTVIPKRSPIAVLMYSPSIVYTEVEVDFDASASYDSDGTIVSYSWDFGDGINSSEATVSHSYMEDGEYLVTLRVVDNEDLVGSKVAIQVVKNRPPVAAFTKTATTLYKEETTTFDASLSYDPDGTIVNYHWDFRDGTTAIGVSVNHSYSESESYRVTLTVTDNDGATDSATSTTNVMNKSPAAIFTESSETGNLGDPITFNAAESYDPDGTIVSYSWAFGDGTTATGVSVSYTFNNKDVYTVTLTVTDNDGATDSAKITKRFVNVPPVASFTSSGEAFGIDETISFDASSSYDSDGTIVSYSWAFGDGTTATGVSVSHAYSQIGTYTVTLTVTDDDGATDNANATKTVSNQAPVASFTESAEIVSSGDRINFDASSSYDSDGTIVSYSWAFGDGTTATGVTADHTYEDNGVYTVTLTVTDDDGATGSSTSKKAVLNRHPVAAFTESDTTVMQNETIHFDAAESYDADGTIVGYLWEFGDGSTTTGVTADHAYSEVGEYTVTLTVTDNDGDSTSEAANIVAETETSMQLALLSLIGLGITTLTATLLYGLFVRRKKKRKSEE